MELVSKHINSRISMIGLPLRTNILNRGMSRLELNSFLFWLNGYLFKNEFNLNIEKILIYSLNLQADVLNKNRVGLFGKLFDYIIHY